MTTDINVGARWNSLNGQQDEDNSSSHLFEKSKIRALADEREHVQKDVHEVGELTPCEDQLQDHQSLRRPPR